MRGLQFSAGYWLMQATFTLAVSIWSSVLAHASLLTVIDPLTNKYTLSSVALAGFVFWFIGLIFRKKVNWLVSLVLGALCYILFSVFWLSMEFFVPDGPFADCSLCALFIVAIVISLSAYGMQANRHFNRDAQKVARPLS
jgi:hypothetical protein